MPGSAPTYNRENATRFERKRAAPGVVLEMWLWSRLGRHPERAWVHTTATPVAGFSALCRLRDHSCVLGPTQHALDSVDARGSHGRRGGIVSGQQPRNIGKLDLL